VVLSGNAAARASSRPPARNCRVGVPLAVIALLHPRLVVFERFGPRGPEDAKALSRGFGECNHHAPGRFLNADGVKARGAPDLVVQDLANRDVFAVYRGNVAGDAL